MRYIDDAERRARLGARHALARPVADPVAAARAVVALHATDPAGVYVAAAARTGLGPTAHTARALYDDRVLLRMLGIRRTMFIAPLDLVPVMQAAATEAVAVVQRTRYEKLIAEAGGGDGAWLRQVEEATLAALRARGSATAAQLSTDVPELRFAFPAPPGKKYGGQSSITTWVLLLLSTRGLIVRGRPAGTWVSSQYVWWPAETWFADHGPESPHRAVLDTADAQVELVRRYLAAFGPATATDIAWWTGWAGRTVKAALARLQPVEVEVATGPALVLAQDVDPVPPPEPWVALLPALDATPMGWSQRDFYLGGHKAALFDTMGNVGPTVWADGRIVGGWAQRPDGAVVFSLLEDVGAETAARIADRAEALTGWMDGVRIVPRFRTPLEKELAG
ncbi:AlkZ family DNA glycosylase [Nakamurella flavida]|uniref:AlkZ family DNA glycosylase n=1 Tax=Nakamurella flavida TaxID=363630 RepID=A0A938YNE4_9ACTN|nr:AlkZ family DNA glycosylase [Nakamurella flavida]